MPGNLRTELSIYVYEQIYKKIGYLNNRSKNFIAWICPMLKPKVTTPNEMVYYEGDEVTAIYFIKSGMCDFILPKYSSTKYLTVPEGSYFGVIDIISSCFMDDAIPVKDLENLSCHSHDDDDDHHDMSALDNWQSQYLRRAFTVRSDDASTTDLLLLMK